jgi:hypothetical protein
MKEYVMLFEEFRDSLNEAKVKPFLSLAINKDDVQKQLKKGKTYWIKKDTWNNWKEFKMIQFIQYNFDYGLKILIDGMPKPEILQTKDFGLYQLSNVDPTSHEERFDAKGKYIKPSRESKKGLWTMKTLKKELKSMDLKDYDDSEAIDMLMDFITTNTGTLEWINKKAGENMDVIDAADWLYSQFS